MHQELPINIILGVELFDVWGVDFMGSLVNSYCMKYILVKVNYISKWLAAISLLDNESKSIENFLRCKMFSRFYIPKTIINDGDSHFCNKTF